MSSAVDAERISARLAEAAYAYAIVTHQDSLLQSYRSFQITFQSTLLAIASATLVLAMQVDGFHEQILSFLVLFSLAGLARFIGGRLTKVIVARGFDVNLAQRTALTIEQTLPPEQRLFCRFKLEQNECRRVFGPDHDDLRRLRHDSLTGVQLETILDRLFDVSKAHTRGQLERMLPMATTACWIILLLIGLAWLCLSIPAAYSGS